MVKLLLPTTTLFLFTSFIMLSTCNKEEKPDESRADITVGKWKVISIATKNKTYLPRVNEGCIPEAYTICFCSDTTYSLNTSVNLYAGPYIKSNIESIVFYPNLITEVYQGDDLIREVDEILVAILFSISTFKIINNSLILHGTQGIIQFENILVV